MSYESFIFELNRNKAQDPINQENQNNAQFTVQLVKPITVNPGDGVAVRMASIDSQKVSDDTIIINSDTNISMTYSTYDFDYTTQDKVLFDGVTAKTSSDFSYYSGYVNTEELNQLQSIVLNIVGFKEPYYNPNAPPEDNTGGSFLIDKTNGIGSDLQWFKVRVTYLDVNGDTQTANLYGNNAKYVAGDDYGWQVKSQTDHTITVAPESTLIYKGESLKITGYGGFWPLATVAPKLGSLPAGSTPGNPGGRGVNSTQFTINRFNVIPATGSRQLDLRTASFLIPKGKYDPKAFAIYMTQLLNSSGGLKGGRNASALIPKSEFLQRSDQYAGGTLFFYKTPTTAETINPTNANSYKYNAPTFFGASVMSLEYGSAGNVFSFNYMHMPIQDPADPGKQTIAFHFNKTSPYDYNIALHASGIVIHDLQPVSFWRDTLGLYSQVIVPLRTDSNRVKYYLESDMTSKITYGYDPLSSFILLPPYHDPGTAPNYNSFRRSIPIPPSLKAPTDPPIIYSDVTGSTRALIGSSKDSQPSGGYFLIELQGIPKRRGGFVNANEINPTVSAIVPKAYDSNNVITGFADSGIPFTHVGQPTMISAIQVRILDENGNLVPDLGTNSCIFVEVTKADPILLKQRQAQEQAQAQKPPKKPETQTELRGGVPFSG